MKFINKKAFVSLCLLSTCMILSSCGPKPTDSFTITWKNDDGSVLKEEKVNSGVLPSYTGTTPSKESTAQYEYTFSGWTPEVVAATKDATYTATYTSNVKSYKITWQNDDGTLLKEDSVKYGETPRYTGDTPTKPSTDEYEYTFFGWTPEVVAATKDVTYTATYTSTKKIYKVTWLNYDDTELRIDMVPYGDMPNYGSIPSREPTPEYSYTFDGWSPSLTSVTGDATYTARYSSIPNKYTLSLVSEDASKGWVSGGGNYEYDKDITITAHPSDYYYFNGWYDKESDTLVSTSAEYKFNMPAYNVTYVAKFRLVDTGPWYQRKDWWNYCSNGVAGEQATISDIGKEAKFTVNGQTHKVRLIGVDHDDLYDTTGKAHCTFEFMDLLSDSSGYSLATLRNSNSGASSKNYDYKNSDLRKALDGQGSGTLRWYQKDSDAKSTTYTTPVFDMLPDDLQGKIKTVKKYVATWSYKIEEYDAKVFSLTHKELTKDAGIDVKEEGTTYQFYSDHGDKSYRSKHQVRGAEGAIISSKEIKDLGWSAYNYAGYNSISLDASHYWIASPFTEADSKAWYVNADCSFYTGSVCGYAYAIAPAFCV